MQMKSASSAERDPQQTTTNAQTNVADTQLKTIAVANIKTW